MGDLISRQWLMECVNEGWIKFDTEKDKNIFIHLVRDFAPSALPKTKWVPVSEKLPKSRGMYIVTRKICDCPDTAPTIMSDECWFGGQNTWHYDNRINHERGRLSDVVAWAPLPKPYEPKESEE